MKGFNKFFGGAVCMTALMLAVNQASAANLVINPGFETGTTTNWSILGAGPGATVTVQTPDNGPSAAGSFNAYMSNTIAAANLALQQSTPLGSAIPGLVSYSFDMKGSISANGGVFFVHIWDVNSTGGVIDQGPGLLGPYFPSTSSWTTITGSFTAPASVNHLEVEFDCTTGAGAGSAEAVHVDNVSLSQVPEPTTMTLVGLGLFGAVTVLRKRKS